MNLIRKLYYNSWNIGFVDGDVKDIVASKETHVQVHWVKHNYKDRFFADPFILSVDENEIRVLVEDFPYYDKRGMISLLVVDRNDYSLKERKVILKQPYHMSYPFIFRKRNDGIIVMPEASQSGMLFRYELNTEKGWLENQKFVIEEPLLDSTICEYNGKWWLFCTKRGPASNSDLYVYYAEEPYGEYKSHPNNPVVSDLRFARPAGNFVLSNGKLYRLAQKCDKYYGEAVNVMRVDTLSTAEYSESFIKEIRSDKSEYSTSFHTLNGCGSLTVVDGLKKEFRPLEKIYFEIRNLL